MKSRNCWLGCPALVIALVAACAPAKASTTIFTGSTAFTTALGTASNYTVGFFPWYPDNPVSSWSTPAFNYQLTATAEAGSLVQLYSGIPGSPALTSNTATKSITLTFPIGAPRAIGGRFFLSNGVTGSGAAFKPGAVTVTVQPGNITQTFSPTSDLVGSFRGFASTDLITSVTVSTTAGWNVTIDDLAMSNGRSIAITQQPTLTAVGATITPAPTVNVVDASGVPYTGTVTISRTVYTGASGAALGGTTTVNAVNGVATFSDLSVNKTGFGYKLTAAAEFVQADTTPFNVVLATYPGRTLTSPTASVDGKVYLGDSAGFLHAVNTSTGSAVFNRDIKAANGVAPANSSRKALGRLTRWNLGGTPRIFCVSSDNYLMVFALDGSPIWTAQLPGGGTAVDASAMVYNDGSNDFVYIATSNGADSIVAKVTATGVVSRQSVTFSGATSTSSVSVLGNSVFFSTPVGSYRLQASDLTVLNAYGAGVAPPFVSSTAGNPVAIVVSTGGVVSAYSATTGVAIGSFGSGGSVDLSTGLYTNYTAFATALGSSNAYTETFDGVDVSFDSPWMSSDLNGLHFTATATGGFRRLDDTSQPPNQLPPPGQMAAPLQNYPMIATNTPGESIVLTLPAGVKAGAGRFTLVDDGGNNASGDVNPITLTLNDGSTSTLVPDEYADTYPWYDRGFISSGDITSLTVSTTSTTSYIAVDDVTVSDYSAPNLSVTAAPFIYGGKVFVAGADNQVYSVNLADGSAAGNQGSKVLSSDAAAYGAGSITTGIGIYPGGPAVVFGSSNGTVLSRSANPTSYSPFNSAWTIGSPINTAPAWDPTSHSFSIAADDGNVYQLPFA